MWYLLGEKDLAVAQVPKAGVNTFRQWLRGYELVDSKDPLLLECSRRILFVRHPLERLQSCYSYFKGLDQEGVEHSVQAPTESWNVFVDYVLNNLTDDVHWLPQVIHAGNAQNIVHRFEDLGEIGRSYYDMPIPWANRSTRMPASAYGISDIMQMYKEDFDLWSQAHSLKTCSR